MPTYDYRCDTCGSSFEMFQSFSEDGLAKCPTKKSGLGPESCTSPGRGKVVKVFNAPGITFKGSGFYKTDNRSGSSGSSASSTSSTSGSSGTSSSSSSSSSDNGSSGSSPNETSKAASSSSSSSSD